MVTVAKFGGKTLATFEQREQAAGIVEKLYSHDPPVYAVFSAFGDTTNKIQEALQRGEFPETDIPDLDALGNSLLRAYRNVKSPELEDAILAIGERAAAKYMSNLLSRLSPVVRLVDFDHTFPLIATGSYGAGVPDLRASAKKTKSFKQKKIYVLPGFAGVAPNGNVMTLGRGGSDPAAFSYGYLFNADRIYLYTDVPGILQAPLSGAEVVPELSIEEAAMAAFLGAKLPYEQAMLPLQEMFDAGKEPEVRIRDCNNSPGTLITKEGRDGKVVKLVASREGLYYIVTGKDASQVPHALEESGAEYFDGGKRGRRSVVLFPQGREAGYKALKRLDIRIEPQGEVCLVGCVGQEMQYQTGVAERFNGALKNAGANIIASVDPSKLAMASILPLERRKDAVSSLYAEFFSDH